MTKQNSKILITGGAGFIGSNTADYYLKRGNKVIVVDNLSRKGTEKNLKWLKRNHQRLIFYKTDIRSIKSLFRIFSLHKPDAVIHLAAQVAVTTSVEDPISDREINIDGTVNILEAIRKTNPKTPFIFASTNKVYGETEHKVKERPTRYEFSQSKIHDFGISEAQNLDFHSPYGCSKGAADQYARDYYRIYGIPTVVFRQSCIYGQRQFGNEDQGWVTHFVLKALKKIPITIFGDGKQVRDILEISDLVKLYDLALRKITHIKGEIFNIGGGPKNRISLIEFIDLLEKKLAMKIKLKFEDWRPGDQKIYISDDRKAKKILGWEPKIGVDKGIDKLLEWAKQVADEIKT